MNVIDKPKLTSKAVDALMMHCLFKDAEEKTNPVIVEGVVRKFDFHPERIMAAKDEIGALLTELPDEFDMQKGGGWSFLNGCMDRHGRHWAEQPTMEALFALAIGAGIGKWLLPREMWPALPGGVPYFSFTAA